MKISLRLKAAFFVFSMTFMSCGPGDSSPAPGLPQAETVAAAKTVGEKLKEGVSSEELVAFIRSLPEFSEAGITVEGDVWAQFTDGRPFVVMMTRKPARPENELTESVARPKSYFGPTNLPEGKTSHVTNVLNMAPHASGLIQTMLNSNGYNTAAGTGTLAEFRGFQNLSVLYVSSHGATIKSKGKPTYALGTGQKVNASCDPNDGPCVNDWKEYEAGLLGLAIYEDDEVEPHYVMLPPFIRKYWSFKPGSFAFIDACNSATDDSGSNEFRGALKEKGLGTLVGWSGQVESGFAERTASYFFDRLLGADSYRKVNPPQRPFVAPEIFERIQAMGEDTYVYEEDGKTYTTTLMLKQYAEEAAILLPSIKYMDIYEEDQKLELIGHFGNAVGEVHVNGAKVTLLSWSDSYIEAMIPATGPQSSGPVVVKVAGHESNVVPLTEWAGSFSHRRTYNSIAPGLYHDVQCTLVRFRGDVHSYREDVDGQPQERVVNLGDATRDSKCNFVLAGTGTKDETTHTLSGSGNLPWFPNSSAPPFPSPWMFVLGNISVPTKTLTVIMNYMGPGTITSVTPNSPPITQPFATISPVMEMYTNPPTMGVDFSVAPRALTVPVPGGDGDTSTLNYSFPTKFAPTQDTAG